MVPIIPCQTCRSPFFWKSQSPIYRCYVCTTPASDKLIQDWVDLRSDDEKLKFQFRWPGRWDETWEEYLGRVLPEVDAGGRVGTTTHHEGSGVCAGDHLGGRGAQRGQQSQSPPQPPPAPDFDLCPGDRLFLGRDRGGGQRWFASVRELMGYGAWPVLRPSVESAIKELTKD